MQEELFQKIQRNEGNRQNLLAIAIVLGGLFVGSLLVDFVQLVSGEGFSAWATKRYNVLETSGKTWVGYGDPKVELTVITDKDCSACDPSEALVWLRRVVPTLEATRIEVSDPTGKQIAERFGIVTLPAFVFSQDITDTSFYAQAGSLFENRDSHYYFDMSKIGLPVGKYLKLPEVREDNIVSGPAEAKVTIVEFSDFECPHCKTLHENIKQTVATYGNDVRVVFKHLPLPFHAQAENAALASHCANEQGKFDVYADHLFKKQAEWSKTTGLQKFRDYAWWLKLDYRKFNDCLVGDSAKVTVTKDREEASNLIISATPATFVNGIFLEGAVSAEDLKQAIDQELR